VHLVSVLHRGARAAVEFAGARDWSEGRGPALLRPVIRVDGEIRDLGASGMAWERAFAWIPSFACVAGDIAVQGTIYCPFGRDTDIAGMVYALSLENRGAVHREVECSLEGVLGSRELRVQSSRPAGDASRASVLGDLVILEGERQPGLAALAIGGDEGTVAHVAGDVAAGDGALAHSLVRRLTLAPGERAEVAFYLTAAPERDGAAATLRAIRARGWKMLLAGTRDSLAHLQQSTGSESLDRLVNRNLVFAYFYSVARALDDSQFYVVRSRAPWSPHGVTVRDWEALTWTIPAVQLSDGPLARELLLRMFELHGYWPGRGVSYVDGTLFAPGFTLEGLASYALALDRYIRDTGDDQIVEEPVVAETMYLVAEDIAARKHARFPLYSTEVDLDGNIASLPYTLHGNAVIAHALDILRRTLDEDYARRLEDPDAVRAAALRHFATGSGGASVFGSSSDLAGQVDEADLHSGSLFWLPAYEFVSRDDSTYRRTARALGERERSGFAAGMTSDASASWQGGQPDVVQHVSLVRQVGQLFGPDGERALEWLRRAPMDGGIAAAIVDGEGRAVSGRGDASLSGLLAYTVWYAAHALGFRA
jgi:hypothetical protein